MRIHEDRIQGLKGNTAEIDGIEVKVLRSYPLERELEVVEVEQYGIQ